MGYGTRLRRARFRSDVLRRPLVAARHRGLRPADCFLVSYPRSGTTWTLFMVCEALLGAPRSFDDLHQTAPYVGDHRTVRPLLPDDGRLIWSHEVAEVGARKVVYLVRDPRSIVSSEYRWQLLAGHYAGPFDPFVDDFLNGRSNPWGAWDRHVDRWQQHATRTDGALLTVRYEDM